MSKKGHFGNIFISTYVFKLLFASPKSKSSVSEAQYK